MKKRPFITATLHTGINFTMTDLHLQ